MKTSGKTLLRNLVIVLGLGAIFAFLGVYDTDGRPFIANLVFWTITMFGGWLFILIVEPFVFGKLLRDRHPLLQLAVIAALISVPIALALTAINTRFTFVWPLVNWLMQFLSVYIIASIIVVGRYVAPQLVTLISPGSATTPQSNASPVESFLNRLPVRYRAAELYAVSSEGHYLRVHTHRGEEMILMRLSDAVRELEGADGLQVHRSWWVARNGIEDTQSKNGRRTLALKSGTRAPVSRSYVQALKDAGLDA